MNQRPTSSPFPDPTVVEGFLDRIFASAEFVRSERMICFLRFVVEHAVNHDRQAINEREIARCVFHKAADWDPTVDTIVRSESRRLRAKLDQYYEALGRNDQLRIRIPKGTYVPEFVWLEEPTPVTSPPEATLLAALPPTRTKFGRWIAFFSMPLVVAAGIVVAVVVLGESRRRGNSARTDSRSAPFTTDYGKEYSPAISPDGKTVAYVWDDGNGVPDLFLRDWKATTSRRLNASPDVRLYPAWSHDGKQIAFLAVHDDRLAVTIHQLATGSEKTVFLIPKSVGQWTEDSSPLLGSPGPVWTARDDALILDDYEASTATGGLIEVDLRGNKTAQLTSTTGELHDLYPRLSPDGKTLAFVRYVSHGVGDIFVLPMADKQVPYRVTGDCRTIQGLTWENNGSSLIFSSNRKGSFQLWSVRTDDGRISPLFTDNSWASEPALAGNWLIYVQANTNWNIWRRAVNGPGPSQRFISSSGRNYDPRYSPDGHRIAFASDRSGHMELWVTDAEGRDSMQLTHLLGDWLGGISWSPDGRSIAFDARPYGHAAAYLISSAGGEPRLLETSVFEERMPAWSPDGNVLYFNSNRDGTTAIFARSLSNGSTHLVSPPHMFAIQASGKELILSNRSGELFHSDTDGAHIEPFPGPLKADPVMSWTSAGSDLYFTGLDPRRKSYTLSRLHQGQLSMLGTLDGVLVPNAPDIAVSSDQRWVLYARQETAQSDLLIRRLQ